MRGRKGLELMPFLNGDFVVTALTLIERQAATATNG